MFGWLKKIFSHKNSWVGAICCAAAVAVLIPAVIFAPVISIPTGIAMLASVTTTTVAGALAGAASLLTIAFVGGHYDHVWDESESSTLKNEKTDKAHNIIMASEARNEVNVGEGVNNNASELLLIMRAMGECLAEREEWNDKQSIIVNKQHREIMELAGEIKDTVMTLETPRTAAVHGMFRRNRNNQNPANDHAHEDQPININQNNL